MAQRLPDVVGWVATPRQPLAQLVERSALQLLGRLAANAQRLADLGVRGVPVSIEDFWRLAVAHGFTRVGPYRRRGVAGPLRGQERLAPRG